MANWASVSYRIEGNMEDIEELADLIEAFDRNERPTMEAGASKQWEGNVILALGIERGNGYLRGFFESYWIDNGVLCIEANEAWGLTDFKDLLESHYDNMNVYYYVEEPGCRVYETNDSEHEYFDSGYNVDSCVDGDSEQEYFSDKEEALSYIAERLGRESITEEELDAWNDEHTDSDDYVALNEISVVD